MSKQPPSPARKPVTLRALAQADEETRIALAQQWWQQNWLSLLGGLVIGAVLAVGIYQWQVHQEGSHQAASNLYFELVSSEAPVEDLSEIDQYDDTLYPAVIRLWYAKLSTDDDDFSKAKEYLQWVMSSHQGEIIGEIARIRWLRILLMEKKYQEVLDVVNLFDYGSYAEPVYEEIRGDAYAGVGNVQEALKAYNQAKRLSRGFDDKLLDLKINQLKSLS